MCLHFLEYIIDLITFGYRMERYFNKERTKQIAFVLIGILIFSLLYSLFLISLSVILLCVLGIAYRLFSRDKTYIIKPAVFISIGILPYLLGLVISDDVFAAIIELQHRVAYLFVPLAAILLPAPDRREALRVITVFIAVMLVSTIPVLVTYGANFEEITASLGMGKSIPTPIDHVRYSIFLSIAAIFSFLLYLRKEKDWISRKWFLLFFGLFFIIVHVLAVRSGIALLYLSLLLVGTAILIMRKKYRWIFLLWIVIGTSPFLAFHLVPSFKNKMLYMKYDVSQYLSGKGENYSDSERLRSLQIGFDIWKEHRVIGVGSGDMKAEVERKYRETFGQEGQPKTPHNQILKVLAVSGILGLLCFLISIYFPVLYQQNYKDPFILSLTIIITVSFLVEATLERSYSLVLYLLLAVILYQSLEIKRSR